MKLTNNELNELKYHYVDRMVDNMSTKDLVQYVFDDMLRYTETISEVDFLDEAQEYWEEHFDDVVKDIKEYANSKVKKPIEDRESSNFFINTNGEN
jgi:hypothetical protein|tara:strand:- start:143 stop:430 length:288 start_codon:yes stop_codon:yes gene_type:complete